MKSSDKFVICISTGENCLLTPQKIYRILSDEKAARSGYIRVIDDEGEDYLYPQSRFAFVPTSEEFENVLF